jgi:hypothetical protein
LESLGELNGKLSLAHGRGANDKNERQFLQWLKVKNPFSVETGSYF